MLKRKKKGFTLVELLVVIAILAVLATVSILGYSSFTKKATISNDESVIAQMNLILQVNQAEENKAKCMSEAIAQVEENGIVFENLGPETKNYHFAYNVETNHFVLLNDIFEEVNSKEIVNKYNVFVLASEEADVSKISLAGFGIYASATLEVEEITVATSFDAGKNTNIKEVKYVQKSGTAHEVVIRTNGSNLTIDAANDTIKHYGDVLNVDVLKVADESYDEFGNVKGKIFLTDGHVDLASFNLDVDVIILGENVEVTVGEHTNVITYTGANTVIKDANGSTVTDTEIVTTLDSKMSEGQVAAAKKFDGLGTVESPFKLENAEDYHALAELNDKDLSGVKFVQTQNIEVTDHIDLKPTNEIDIEMGDNKLTVSKDSTVNNVQPTKEGENVSKDTYINKSEKTSEGHTHSFTSEVVADTHLKAAATCQAKATYFKSCSCGENGSETFESGEKANHTLSKTNAKAATCVATGNNDYWTCSVCIGVFADENGTNTTTVENQTIAINETAHNWDTNWTTDTAATESTAGSKSHHCLNAGCTAKNDVTEIPKVSSSIEVSTAAELQTALNNTANNGKTIKLTANISSGSLTFSQSGTVTLDLNGKTLTLNGNASTRGFYQSNGNLTIKNGTIITTSSTKSGFYVGNGETENDSNTTTTTFDGVNFKCNNGYAICDNYYTNATITIKNCDIDGIGAGRGIYMMAGKAYINSVDIDTAGPWYGIGAAGSATIWIDDKNGTNSNTTVDCTASNGTPLYTNENGTIYVYGGTYKNPSYTAINVNNNKLHLYGGSYTGKVTGNGSLQDHR